MTAPEAEDTAPLRPSGLALYRQWAQEAAAGLSSLAPAMASAPAPVSPPMARAAQATENAWRRIDAEFGLLTSTEAAERMGYGPNRSWASTRRREGRLLGVRRGGAYRYPGFQLDADVLPAVAEIISFARSVEWSDESVVLWLCAPSGWLPDDDRPVDHLHTDPELVIRAARAALAPQW